MSAVPPLDRVGTRVVPRFLGPADHPWLRVLLDERGRFIGRKQRELEDRLASPLPCAAPRAKLAFAIACLRRIGGTAVTSKLSPRTARDALFVAGAADEPRTEVLASVAAALATTPDEIEAALFADLPGERTVTPLDIEPTSFAARANEQMVRSLLARSETVGVEAFGHARPLVRYAQLRGLIVTVSSTGADGFSLEISGPLSLFRRTLVYGRALGDLVPSLAWCHRFRLLARCLLPGGPASVELASGDPILPSNEPRPFDSRLEERFAIDLRRLAPEWDLIREPAPIQAGTSLIFPDFALTHREQHERRWFVEIVGFWTPGYLEQKLTRLRAAGIRNLILCVDETRGCAEDPLPSGARVVPFKRRIDPRAVLRATET